MSWVLISLIGSILSALVSIFDKTITYRFGQSSKVLPLLVGILQTSVGLSLLIVLSIFNNEIFNQMVLKIFIIPIPLSIMLKNIATN